MKKFIFICAIALFIATLNLPIGYYTFLRILITIGAISLVAIQYNKKADTWIILFILIAILFNPILPIYLNSKKAWLAIDITCGILFLIKAISLKK